AEVCALLRDYLGGRRLRLVDRFPDLGDDADPDLLDLALVLADEAVRDVEREEVVQLADMGDGILAGRGLHGHRSVRGDEAADAVPAPDAAVIPVLPGQPGDREIENPGVVIRSEEHTS